MKSPRKDSAMKYAIHPHDHTVAAYRLFRLFGAPEHYGSRYSRVHGIARPVAAAPFLRVGGRRRGAALRILRSSGVIMGYAQDDILDGSQSSIQSSILPQSSRPLRFEIVLYQDQSALLFAYGPGRGVLVSARVWLPPTPLAEAIQQYVAKMKGRWEEGDRDGGVRTCPMPIAASCSLVTNRATGKILPAACDGGARIPAVLGRRVATLLNISEAALRKEGVMSAAGVSAIKPAPMPGRPITPVRSGDGLENLPALGWKWKDAEDLARVLKTAAISRQSATMREAGGDAYEMHISVWARPHGDPALSVIGSADAHDLKDFLQSVLSAWLERDPARRGRIWGRGRNIRGENSYNRAGTTSDLMMLHFGVRVESAHRVLSAANLLHQEGYAAP